MVLTVAKATGIWLLIAVAAIINGLLREVLLVPLVGTGLALPLSGVVLSALVFAVSFLSVPFIGKTSGPTYVGIGLLWVVLTVAFEIIFGRYASGKSWQEIAQVLNILRGDLLLLVLFISLISPLASARLRGFL